MGCAYNWYAHLMTTPLAVPTSRASVVFLHENGLMHVSFVERLSSGAPSLADLTLLRWTDDKGKTHRLKLLNLISNEWRDAGLLLELNTAELENIEQKTNDDERRFALVFTRWIDNDGQPPQYRLSWDGLCDLLYDLDRDSAAEELKQALKKLSL